MNKETIKTYLNTLFIKSKNDLRTGCSLNVITGLLGLDKNNAQNILYYLSGKGLVATDKNYGDNISLTPEGFDYIMELRDGKQFKIIKFFKSHYVHPGSVMRFGFIFWYDLIDQNGTIEKKTVSAFASDILSMTWGLRFDESGIKNSEKILLQFAKEHVSKQLLDGTLSENEEFTLMTSSQPQTCPYDPKNLIDTKFAEYEIEIIKKEKILLEPLQKEQPILEIAVSSPTVFISYSWDDEAHKDWILNLTKRLFDKGVNVLLDRMELRPGKNMIHFMESSIPKSNKVLIVFTPNYKLKAEKRQGGVGFEYSILNAELYNQITTNEKYIPILKSGNFSESIPAFMQQFIGIDMTKSEAFEEKFNELVYAIYDKPQIEKPKIGINPFIGQPQLNATEQTNDLLKEVEKETNILTKESIELEVSEKEIVQEIKEPISKVINDSPNKHSKNKSNSEYLSTLEARLEKQINYKEKFDTIYIKQTDFLEKLEDRLERQQDFLEKLNDQLDDLEDKYANAWDTNFKDKISQWIEEKKIKIVEVEDGIHSLQDKIEDVKENVFELPDRIKSIETSITTLETKINAAKNKV